MGVKKGSVKGHLYLICILLIFLTACTPGNEPVKEPEPGPGPDTDGIKVEGGIEMRGQDLWLGQEQLNKLQLDGNSYALPQELLDQITFSHVKIQYPLLVYNTNQLYHLEEQQTILSFEEILSDLEAFWETFKEEVNENPYGEFMELEPGFFSFMDGAALSPSGEEIAFSLHHYFAATFTTLTGRFSRDKGEAVFAPHLIPGQVQVISWSPDEQLVAFVSANAADKWLLTVFPVSRPEGVVVWEAANLWQQAGEGETAPSPEQGSIRIKLLEWEEQSRLLLELEYLDPYGETMDQVGYVLSLEER